MQTVLFYNGWWSFSYYLLFRSMVWKFFFYFRNFTFQERHQRIDKPCELWWWIDYRFVESFEIGIGTLNVYKVSPYLFKILWIVSQLLVPFTSREVNTNWNLSHITANISQQKAYNNKKKKNILPFSLRLYYPWINLISDISFAN